MGKYATKEQLTALVADMASKINIASGTQGVSGSYVPIGFIEGFMGVEAPPDFLVCDGSLHSIASYPQLADHFYEQFGASNYFGGNGTTTFAVPELRGEFLRGAGTNSHANQGSGGDVGEHQDGTEFPKYGGWGNGNNFQFMAQNNKQEVLPEETDSVVGSASFLASINASANDLVSSDQYFTSRPTNTSVLWCIKAIDEKIQPGKGGIDYSTEEQDTGLKWIDGKPIYQKTVTGLSIAGEWSGQYYFILANQPPLVADIDTMISAIGYTSDGNLVYVNIECNSNAWKYTRFISDTINTITIQYTKTTDD